MASNGTCAKDFTEENWNIVLRFPKTFAERLADCYTFSCRMLKQGCYGLFYGCGYGLAMLFFLCVGLAFLFVASFAFVWIPVMMTHCHKGPGLAMGNFAIENMVPFQANPNLTGSPWLVNSSFSATFWAWNRNTVTKCFTTLRELDVVVEYKTQVILQQQFPLHFSLKPREIRNFTMEMNETNVLLGGKPELVPYMQAESKSGNITLDVYYAVRYLQADRKSKWVNNTGCVILAHPPSLSSLGTAIEQNCYSI